ncbi:MAG: penicillin-binding protein 1B [Wenzhouxiangellaceae bacterium]
MSRKRKAQRAAEARPRWIGVAWFLLGLGIGLFLCGVLPWAWYLDRLVVERFTERQWSQAGRVFARPLELYPGLQIAPADLELELNASGLRRMSPTAPGRWSRSGNRWVVWLPNRSFSDGREPAMRIELVLRDRHIEQMVADDGRKLDLARLPPAELGSLLPLDSRDRTLVPLEAFPPLLVTGVQAVEDRQFRHHHGLDPRAILRALLRNLRAGGIEQGGSTITQQLVKNLFLDSRQNLLRKFNEALMALSMEAHFSKAEILEAYLNEVYLGQDGRRAIHGFGRAAEEYFGVPVSDLDVDQIALLIGMVRGASWYHPVRNPERALARRNQVLEIFHQTGLIDAGTLKKAVKRPLGVTARSGVAHRNHPAFMDLVRRQLRADYRERDLREKGLRIYTTLSPSVQTAAEQALVTRLKAVEQAPGGLQGALVVVEPSTGEIRALVGDRHPNRPGFNRALDARRQIGSVIKPFVYLLALAQPERYSLVTPLKDHDLEVDLPGQTAWRPENHDGISHGDVPLMEALVQSYNQATVFLGRQIGLKPLFGLLEQLGVAPGTERHPAAFLGAIDLTPLQVAQLYQALASAGYATPLRAITDVVDARGRSIARYPIRLRPIREKEALALLDFALEQVIDEGTARGLRSMLNSTHTRGIRFRGKTGTTSDRRDAWFAGYTDQWLAVVWVGRDDNRPAAISGSSAALPVWAGLMDRLPHTPSPVRWPAGLEWFWIDWPRPLLADRNCPGARALPFIPGSEPDAVSGCIRRR